MKQSALLFVFLLFSFVALSPKTQATSVEKFPTSNETVVAGWINPTKAYVEDSDPTYTETSSGAEQEYYDFGFSFTTETIERVFMRLSYMWYYSGLSSFWFMFTFEVEVYDGSEWNSYTLESATFGSDAFAYYNSDFFRPKAYNITDSVSSASVLNDLHIRIKWTGDGLPDNDRFFGVDFISVTVFYNSGTSGADTFPDGFIAGVLLAGTVGLVGVLVVKKRS